MDYTTSGNVYLKLLVITSMLVVVFQFGTSILSSQSEIAGQSSQNISENETQTSNNEQYQSAYAANYGSVGVALSTRIGMQYSNGSVSMSNTYYRDIQSLGKDFDERNTIREQLISQNMLIIREYLNLSRTDVKQMLNTSSNRKATLEGFISQLENRHKNSALSIQSLQSQKTLLVAEIERLSNQIEATKTSMQNKFGAFDEAGTIEQVNTYYDLRQEYTEAFTDVVFVNQFIKQHEFLNNYNRTVLDTLINNKKALINESFVVLPDSGTQFLKPLDLILDEAEFKSNAEVN